MAKTIRARFTGGHVEFLEKSEIPEGAELTITFEEKLKDQNETRQGKWAQVAEDMDHDSFLDEIEHKVLELGQDFRKSFSFIARFDCMRYKKR
ncbi:protein belonging to Uncharacterized protein family UPF0165 [Candidatus Magnetobacterium bavaricum]|uniref:Protein belonging to Uncharacterized protein family UPF0165 n=1 Tax=Candidatus Magnetobacterium bavaricum TaxID=29290 RepID=A0A0F3GW80_9BACT|nr:protein belonging to Uncharacterized protein family UPF0165 [Candidatus Magnetobacterium bavaricum]